MQAAMQRGDFVDERFEIETLAGAGGMGMVYRARDRETGKLVAIKLLHNADVSHTARFMREIHALSSVTHEHVVQYITHGVTDADEPYLVMEWLEGDSLDDRLSFERLTLAEALELARHVAEALGAAHARGIVHRDIKPSNLFLVDGDVARVKVLDFGIAHFTEDTRPITLTNQVIGTAGYMAPEQARGEQARVDARSDVFSLGCVLFECLTGRPAFEGVHLMALLSKLLLNEAPRVRALKPDVPAGVDALVARMLDRDPTERPANGMAVAQALAALATGADEAGAEESPAVTPSARAERCPVTAVTVSLSGRTPVEVATTMVLRDGCCELPAQARFLLQGKVENDAASEAENDLESRPESRPESEAMSCFSPGTSSRLAGRTREPWQHLAAPVAVARHRRDGPWLIPARGRVVLAGDLDQDDEHALAASFHDRAALQALRGPDLAAVPVHVQRGLALGPDAQTRAGLHASHAAACFWRADHAASYESARRALDLATPGTPAYWLALSMAIFSAGYTGQREAFAHLVASLNAAVPGPDTDASAALDRFMLDALWGAFAVLVTSGLVNEAERCLLCLERIVSPRREREPFAAACLETAYTYWYRYVERAPWAALEHGRATLALCERASEPSSRDLQQALLVACELMELGAFAEAEQIVVQWPGEAPGVAGMWRTYARAMLYASTDRVDDARALATTAEARAHAHGDHALAARLRYVMIHCALQRGDIDEAEQMLHVLGEPGTLRIVDRPEFLATQARIQLAQGRPREAVRLASEAVAADDASGIGVYWIRPTCWLVRAEALHVMGEIAAARQALRAAQEDLLARASGIDDPDWRFRFLHEVPMHARLFDLAHDWLGHEAA